MFLHIPGIIFSRFGFTGLEDFTFFTFFLVFGGVPPSLRIPLCPGGVTVTHIHIEILRGGGYPAKNVKNVKNVKSSRPVKKKREKMIPGICKNMKKREIVFYSRP